MRIVAGSLLSGYLTMLFIVNFTPAQRWLSALAEDILREKLHTAVSIDRVELGLFNRIILHGLRVNDRQNVPMISAQLLSAKIEYLPLLQGQVSLRSVSLLDGTVNLYKTRADSAANYQFFLDAFSSGKKGPSKLNLSLNSLILRRCKVSYNERYKTLQPRRFDLAHISLSGLEANVSLKALTADSINLRVRKLAFLERSGLEVRNLSFRLSADNSCCQINDFELSLPNSRIRQENLKVNYKRDHGASIGQTLRVRGHIGNAAVYLPDVACFLPKLRDIPSTITLATDFDVRPKNIRIRHLYLRDSHGAISLRGWGELLRRDSLIVRTDIGINSLTVSPGRLSGWLDSVIPPSVTHVTQRMNGDLSLTARMQFVKDKDYRISGELKTTVGHVDFSLSGKEGRYEANVSTENLSLSPIFNDTYYPDSLAFHVTMDGIYRKGKVLHALADLDLKRAKWRGHLYRRLLLTADWKPGSINATLESSDTDLDMTADASATLQGKHLRSFMLNADVRRFSPAELSLPMNLDRTVYSGKIDARIPSLLPHAPKGYISVSDFTKSHSNDHGNDYYLRHMRVDFSPSQRGTYTSLRSDFADVEFDGPLSAETLQNSLRRLLVKALPGAGLAEKQNLEEKDNHEWAFVLTLKKADFFNKILGFPLYFNGDVNVHGRLSPLSARSSVVVTADTLGYGGVGMRDLRCYIHEYRSDLALLLQGIAGMGGKNMKMELSAGTRNGQLSTELIWDDGAKHSYSGSLKTLTGFTCALSGQMQADMQFLPTTLTVRDTTWNVGNGNVTFTGKRLDVHNVRLSHADQSLAIDGSLIPGHTDSLMVRLHKINVDYILGLINLRPVSFSGLATGHAALLSGKDKLLEVRADLRIPDFHFNDGFLGHAHIKGRFGTEDKRLFLDANITERGVGSTLVNGYVGIGEKCIDLDVHSKNTSLYFLRRYISDIFSDVSGRTTGHVRIHGPFKQLDFDGEERADMTATVNATGSQYKLSDGQVDISTGIFRFKNYKLTDALGGRGQLEGELHHIGLKNITYDFRANTEHLQLYNKGRSADLPFYATAFGTGHARLYGVPGSFTADINMRPDAGTLFTYVVDTPGDAYDVSLLTYGEKSDSILQQADTVKVSNAVTSHVATPAKSSPETDIYLNFHVDMSPEAQLKVITDQRAGNYILLAGDGALRATYYNKGAFQMFGTYTVRGGLYKMIIQDVIHKDLQMQNGGSIIFAGDPYEGDLHLKAIYTVPSASLSDLGLNFSDKTIRADCVLNLTGKVKSPQVDFDLDLPTASDDVRQMVRQLITSEEDMNMQMIYLLGIGRFYNYNYAATEAAAGGQAQSSVAMKSFLSNTLSGQLNNFISNAVGASNWTFGANLATGSVGWSDMEVAGLLSGRLLNNRLLVNGNFGYRDRAMSTTNFVGDFDINYLLTPSGSVSLKAYSETNDRYFSKSSMTTQGIGVQLKRDFSSLRDLFTPRHKKKRAARQKK